MNFTTRTSRKLKYIILIFYICFFIFPFIRVPISSGFLPVDLESNLKDSGCLSPVDLSKFHSGSAFDVLFPINFYLHYDFWVADWHLPKKVIMDDKCFSILRSTSALMRKETTVFFIDDDGSVFSSIKFFGEK